MRKDLAPGKAVAQAVHGAIRAFNSVSPDTRQAFLDDGPVVVLTARDEAHLRALAQTAEIERVPNHLFEDESKRGVKSLTCLGIGPVCREAAGPITDGLRLVE